MVLPMPRPHKHPKTGIYYFRQKTPVDLVDVFGKKEVGWSLKTKDPEEAKVRNVEAVRKQAMLWESLRRRPEPLPHQQIVALSGIFYRDYMAHLEQEPGEPAIWTETLALLDRLAANSEAQERWYEPTIDNLLLQHGLVTDEVSRKRLILETDRAFRQVAEQQLKRSEGDYTPDLKANRFPAVASPNERPKESQETPSIRAMFKLWERDHLSNGKSARTAGDFRHKIESLVSYVGHDEADRVTAEEVADWCD